MTALSESELGSSLRRFHEALAEFVGSPTRPVPFADLVIDDKQIRQLKEIASTNGRYRFRDPEIYRDCYIPHATSPGVYLFFNANGIAVYVGKSEVPGGIGKRVASHIGKLQADAFPYLHFETAQYVITVPFQEAPWLAPALESFLLGTYTFEYNLSLSDRERFHET